MPNQILFSIAKLMPETINEFKDCCRNSYGNMMLKYQDQILALIDKAKELVTMQPVFLRLKAMQASVPPNRCLAATSTSSQPNSSSAW